MATWTEFTAEASEIAEVTERRLLATGLMMLATLRRDGFPRISPVEVVMADGKLLLHDDRLWMGMMPGATKSLDLRRDRRFAVHTATADKNVSDGDAKFWGVATQVTGDEALSRLSDDIYASVGHRFEVGEFDAFVLDLAGASTVVVRDDTLFVSTWLPGKGVTVAEKH
jgi:hypothetical protein